MDYIEDGYTKMVFKFGGEELTIRVKSEDEPFFSDARNLIYQRMNTLSQQYATQTHSKALMMSMIIEATVDALKTNEKYHKLKSKVKADLDSLLEIAEPGFTS
jgi:hypothetical protein